MMMCVCVACPLGWDLIFFWVGLVFLVWTILVFDLDTNRYTLVFILLFFLFWVFCAVCAVCAVLGGWGWKWVNEWMSGGRELNADCFVSEHGQPSQTVLINNLNNLLNKSLLDSINLVIFEVAFCCSIFHAQWF